LVPLSFSHGNFFLTSAQYYDSFIHKLWHRVNLMAKIFVSATNKGGEGKTTTSINLAEYASIILNKKVLLIDLDPQANLSGRYIPMDYDPSHRSGKIPPLHPDYNPEEDLDWEGRSSIANIFYGEEVVPYPTAIPNLELLPAHSQKLLEAEAVTKNDVLEKVHVQLKRFIDLPDLQKGYDLVIIDTPPSKGPLTIAAIKAASHLIIPAQMEQFSIEGIYGMLQLWKQESYRRTPETPIELVGILPNKYRDINLHKEFLAELRQMRGIGNYVLANPIKVRAVYSEILVDNASPKSIFELKENHIARIECEKACSAIMQKVFAHGETKVVLN
jgi:chromosome partitioning protein